MARLLLVIPSSTYRAQAFLQAAATLGVSVVVASDVPDPFGHGVEVCLDDPAGAVSLVARRGPFDAVVGVDGAALRVSAACAEAFGLGHHSSDSLRLTGDKLAQRRAFHDAGVPQPSFRALRGGGDPSSVASEVGFPAVLKPTGLQAGRGVIRVDGAGEARWAAARIRDLLALEVGAGSGAVSAELIVESFVPGAEVALEGLVVAGELLVLACFDKPEQGDGPFFEETTLVTPSRLPEADRLVAESVAAQAVAALGLGDGPVHIELRVRDGQAKVLEAHGRSIGGLCSKALRFDDGATLEELVLRRALGWPLPLPAMSGASGVYMIPVPHSGRFAGLRGVEAALAVDGVTEVLPGVPAGRIVRPVPDGGDYLGFIFACADTPSAVCDALRRAAGCVEPMFGAL